MQKSAPTNLISNATQLLQAGDFSSAYDAFASTVALLGVQRGRPFFEALLGRAQAALMMGDGEKLQYALREAERAIFQQEVTLDDCDVVSSLAQLLDQAGQSHRAIPLYASNIHLLEQHPDQTVAMVKNQINLSVAYQNCGDLTLGWKTLDEAEILSQQIYDHPLRALCCYNVALREGHFLGNHEAAKRLLEEALVILEAQDPFATYHLCLLLYAKTLEELGKQTMAFTHAGKASWAAQVIQDSDVAAEAMALQARFYEGCRRLDKADLMLQTARETSPTNLVALIQHGAVNFGMGKVTEALTLLENSLSSSINRRLPWSQMMSHYWLAQVHRQAQVPSMAQYHIREAHQIAADIGARLGQPYHDRLMHQNQDIQQVLTLYANLTTGSETK